jgi:hypothetical protein
MEAAGLNYYSVGRPDAVGERRVAPRTKPIPSVPPDTMNDTINDTIDDAINEGRAA